MWYKTGIVSLFLFAALGTGCEQPGFSVGELGSGTQGLARDNGLEFNGLRSNGLLSNGLRSNGLRSNGLLSNGLDVSGVTSHVTSVVDGAITAVADDLSVTFNSSQLSGSVIQASLEGGATAKFRIDSVTYDANVGTNLYRMSSWDGSAWVSACGTDPTGYYAPAGTEIPAIALADTWNLVDGANVSDPNLFTLSCVNAAIGKCVVWGYKRWTSTQECLTPGNCKTRDLAFFHQACTRLVRADYCGNGTYHTQNGTSIDVYDALAIQSRTPGTGWEMEAEWRYDGAHCIHHTRWTAANSGDAASDLAYVEAKCPTRLASHDASCADSSASHYFTANGFNDALADRSVLRNDSYVH